MYEFFRGKAWVCGHALVGMAKVIIIVKIMLMLMKMMLMLIIMKMITTKMETWLGFVDMPLLS